MAFTREFIRKAAKESGVEIPKEFEDALVQEHLTARDAYADGQVKTALEENKQDPPPAVKDTQEYKDLKKEYEDYKAGVTAKETKSAKEAAARTWPWKRPTMPLSWPSRTRCWATSMLF